MSRMSVSIRGRYLEDFSEGEVFTTAHRAITETDVLNYAGLSGDFNALHFDEAFAKENGYRGRIAHGPCVYSVVTGLVTGLGIFDRTNIAFAHLEWTFIAPVYINDTVVVKLTVRSIRNSRTKTDRGVLVSDLEVTNGSSEIVQQGVWTQIQMRRPSQQITANNNQGN